MHQKLPEFADILWGTGVLYQVKLLGSKGLRAKILSYLQFYLNYFKLTLLNNLNIVPLIVAKDIILTSGLVFLFWLTPFLGPTVHLSHSE